MSEEKDVPRELPLEVTTAKQSGSTVLELTGEDGRSFFFKKPGKGDLDRYLAMVMKKKLAQASQNLVFDLALSPSKDELDGMIKENPGMQVALSSALQSAVGLNEEFAVKKL
jgi:hypothetical protein